jgi:hypothetical protein
MIDPQVYLGSKVAVAFLLVSFGEQPLSSILYAVKTRNRTYVQKMMDAMGAENFVTVSGSWRSNRYSYEGAHWQPRSESSTRQANLMRQKKS